MPSTWTPDTPPPRPIPWGFFLDRVWMDFIRVLVLFLVLVIIAWLRADFTRQFDFPSRWILRGYVVVAILYLIVQAWSQFRLMRDGVCVKADVLDISLHGRKKYTYRVTLRWSYGGRIIERERYFLNEDAWQPFIEKLREEKQLIMFVFPNRPTMGIPLHFLTAPRPKTIKAILFGG